VVKIFAGQQAERRFIPYMANHEFEALLFSDEAFLAAALGIPVEDVIGVIDECGEPEAVNNSRQTASSKRFDAWSARKKFPKTTTGITVAKEIGVTKMCEKCPQFNAWIKQFELIVQQLNKAEVFPQRVIGVFEMSSCSIPPYASHGAVPLLSGIC
jgi:hypothetical protein